MRLLLDTHVVLWALADNPLLGANVRSILASAEHTTFVSAATIWEAEIKIARGKLQIDGDLRANLSRTAVKSLEIGWLHAEVAARLPPHPRDPFDRMLIAQSHVEALTLVSADHAFASYEVTLLDPRN